MKFSKEIQIALVAVAGVVVLFFGLQFLKGLSLLSDDNSYYVKFDNVSGLTQACPIFANGYRVGVVAELVYDYERNGAVVAKVGLDKKLRVPQGSQAQIASDMLGNVKLELKLGQEAGTIAPGDTIVGGMESGMLNKAADLLPHVERMIPKLDSILTSINTLLADPAIAGSLHNVETITADLTNTTAQLNRLTASLNKQMPQVLDNANGTLAKTNELTAQLKALDVASTMQKVNTTLQNVEQMTAKLNSNEGTLGLLMRDPQLYMNLNATMMHADSLMIDLKQHPKRYVHFSIFGKKDK